MNALRLHIPTHLHSSHSAANIPFPIFPSSHYRTTIASNSRTAGFLQFHISIFHHPVRISLFIFHGHTSLQLPNCPLLILFPDSCRWLCRPLPPTFSLFTPLPLSRPPSLVSRNQTHTHTHTQFYPPTHAALSHTYELCNSFSERNTTQNCLRVA